MAISRTGFEHPLGVKIGFVVYAGGNLGNLRRRARGTYYSVSKRYSIEQSGLQSPIRAVWYSYHYGGAVWIFEVAVMVSFVL